MPFDHEQRPFDPTELAQSARQQIVLREGGKLFQHGRGRDDAALDRQADAKQLVPGLADRTGVDAFADMPLQQRIDARVLESVQPPVLQVSQPRCKPLAEQGKHPEDVVVGAAGIDIVLIELEPAFLAVEPVKNIGHFALGRTDRQDRSAHADPRSRCRTCRPGHCHSGR